MKAVNFEKVQPAEPEILKMRHIKKLTKKQSLMIKISQYLFEFGEEQVRSIFRKRLEHLCNFIALKRV